MSIVNRESRIVNRGSDETANFRGASLCSSKDMRKQVPRYRNRRGMTTLADVNFD